MSLAMIITCLILAILIFISTAYSSRNKNIECYQGMLTILLLISTKVILYALSMIALTNSNYVETLFTINATLTPVIASLVLLSSLASASTFSHSKVAKQIIGLIAFFFIGVILTNPFHKLAFTLNSANTINDLKYTEGLLLNISTIYSGICVLSSFIIVSYNILLNKMYCRKLFAFIGTTFAILAYMALVYTPNNINEELIIWGSISLILYLYVFVNNDFNFIPIIKDNTFELINDGMLVVNKKYLIKDYNKSLTQLFKDIDFTNVIGKKIDDVFKYYPVVTYAIKSGKNESIKLGAKDYSMLLYNSIEKHKRDSITTITFKEATTISIIADKEQSNCDPLTKLKTKDDFYRDAEYEFNNAVRYNLPFVLAIIEINDLYKIKSELGEIAGNLLLTDVSALIKKEIRKTDILARIGDDRFALLLTHTKLKFVENVAERIRKRVEKNALAYEDDLIQVTISIGVTGTDEVSNQSIDTFIAKVEDALEMAKKQGKNCVFTNYIK